MRKDTSNIVIKNRKVAHDYEFIEKLIAGIKLTGTEIKSIRAGKANLTDSFVHLLMFHMLTSFRIESTPPRAAGTLRAVACR